VVMGKMRDTSVGLKVWGGVSLGLGLVGLLLDVVFAKVISS